MDNEIVLSAKELYYLGKLMQARYIDYSYIAAMDDVGKNYSVFESESEKSLSDKGCIEEDFAGEKEVNPVLECLLEPVFFGERRSVGKRLYRRGGACSEPLEFSLL